MERKGMKIISLVFVFLLLLCIPSDSVSAVFGVFNKKDTEVVKTSIAAYRGDMIKLGSSNNVVVAYLSGSSRVNISTYSIDSNGGISDDCIDIWTLDYPTTAYYDAKILHVYGNIYLVVRFISSTKSFRLTTLSISDSGVISKSIISGKNHTSPCSEGLSMSLLHVPLYDKVIIYSHASSGGSTRSAMIVWGCSDAGTLSATCDEEHVVTIVGYTGNVILVDDDTIASVYSHDATTHYVAVVTHNISGAGLLTGGDAWTFSTIPSYGPFIMNVYDDVYAVGYQYSQFCLNTFRISDTGVITKSFLDTEIVTANTGVYPSMLNVGTVSGVTSVLYSYGDTAAGGVIKLYNISSAGIISYISNYGYWDLTTVSGFQYMVKNWNCFVIAFMTTTSIAFRLDSFVIDGVAESGGSTEELICGSDVSLYTRLNSLPYTEPAKTRTSVLTGKAVIETYYGGPVTTTVTGVSLMISNAQYSFSSDVDNYNLMMNGVDIGHPLCIDVYGTEDTYRLFWSCAEYMDYTGILFEFKNTVSDSSGIYWNSLPVDTVSSSGWNFGKYSTNLFNGFYDGNDLIMGVSTNLEFQMSFWSSSFIFENETSPYDDLITSSGTTFETYTTVPIAYYISDFSYTNTIEIWREGTQLSLQGFPLTIPTGYFDGETSFMPFQNGSYQLRLMRNGVVRSSFNFTVTDPLDVDFILAVYPNPFDYNTEVKIGYRFYPDDGAVGFIGVSDSSTTSNLSSFDEYWMLSANESGNKSLYPLDSMYVSLWKKTDSVYTRKKITYAKMRGFFDNTIKVRYSSIQLSVEYPEVKQQIYGTHGVQGFTMFIRLNNKVLLPYVTNEQFYSIYVDISKAGNYNAELCMQTANGTVVLCSVNFTAWSWIPGGEEADAFSPEMKLLFGVCCILVAVSCPLMVSVKYHIVVPTFIYVVFMAFGIGIGTILGWLELWLVFLFVVALVAGAVFTIFGHGGIGGGGGDSGVSRTNGVLSHRGGKDYATSSRKADYGVSPKGSPGYLKGPGRRGY